ncbi:hypothetical protein DV736_g6267, partial [Chaetothyriales sp. CBS 134916]
MAPRGDPHTVLLDFTNEVGWSSKGLSAIMWSVVLNGSLAFVMGCTPIFCLSDLDSVLSTVTYEPFIYNATQSYGGTNTIRSRHGIAPNLGLHPLHTVTVLLVANSLLACINIGSSTALNAINSLGSVAILTSYYITTCCIIYHRLKGPPLAPRRWSLGKEGLWANITALCFLTPV